MKLINGQALAEKIKDEVARDVFNLDGAHPSLAIILAGDREDSKLYVSLKEQEAKKVGIDTHLYKVGALESEADLLELIKFLNNDETVDGILVQLPLPERFQTDKIIAAIDPLKDADGFQAAHPDYIISPVFAAVLKCLEDIKFDLDDEPVAILHNSDIFGQSLQAVLEKRGARVRTVSVKNFDKLDEAASQKKLDEITAVASAANVVITALGLAKFIKKEMIKAGAVLIDIGITKINGHVYGDFDFEDVKDKAGFLTPVPGGIGPLTIALIFKNVLEIYYHRHNSR